MAYPHPNPSSPQILIPKFYHSPRVKHAQFQRVVPKISSVVPMACAWSRTADATAIRTASMAPMRRNVISALKETSSKDIYYNWLFFLNSPPIIPSNKIHPSKLFFCIPLPTKVVARASVSLVRSVAITNRIARISVTKAIVVSKWGT